MKPPPLPPGVTPTGRLIDPRPFDQRDAAICSSVAELITAQDLDDAMAAIRRGLKAQTTVRAPRRLDAPRNDYVFVPDVAAQLAAARLLFAYKFGNPASVLEMRLPDPTKASQTLTREEMIERLRTSGADINAIVDVWIGAAKQAERTGPLPSDVQETMQRAGDAKIIEV